MPAKILRYEFTRSLLEQDGRSLIQSICAACGFKIVGSVAEHLKEDEDSHREKCKRPTAKGEGA